MAEVTHLYETHESWHKSGPIVSNIEEVEIERLEGLAAASIADPSVMGLWAYATATWIAATAVTGIFPFAASAAAIPVLASFGGVALFVAGLFAYRRANVLTSTAFCSYGSLNVALAGFLGMVAAGALPAGTWASVVQGFLFESFAFISLALTIAAIKTNAMTIGWLATATIGYALVGIPFLADAAMNGGWGIVEAIGGYFLMAAAAFAYVAGATLVVNSIWQRTVIPMMGRL